MNTAEKEKVIGYCMEDGDSCEECLNARNTSSTIKCGINPMKLAVDVARAYRNTLTKVLEQCNDCPCEWCSNLAFLPERAEDYPEDVEPCPFKRARGLDACVDGIVEKNG